MDSAILELQYTEARMLANLRAIKEMAHWAESLASRAPASLGGEDVLSLLDNFSGGKNVDWDAMTGIAPFKYIEIGRNAYAYLIPTTVSNQLMFYTILGPESFIDLHTHKTFVEHIYHKKGACELLVNGRWQPIQGHTRFDPGMVHAARSRKGVCAFYVEFIRHEA